MKFFYILAVALSLAVAADCKAEEDIRKLQRDVFTWITSLDNAKASDALEGMKEFSLNRVHSGSRRPGNEPQTTARKWNRQESIQFVNEARHSCNLLIFEYDKIRMNCYGEKNAINYSDIELIEVVRARGDNYYIDIYTDRSVVRGQRGDVPTRDNRSVAFSVGPFFPSTNAAECASHLAMLCENVKCILYRIDEVERRSSGVNNNQQIQRRLGDVKFDWNETMFEFVDDGGTGEVLVNGSIKYTGLHGRQGAWLFMNVYKAPSKKQPCLDTFLLASRADGIITRSGEIDCGELTVRFRVKDEKWHPDRGSNVWNENVAYYSGVVSFEIEGVQTQPKDTSDMGFTISTTDQALRILRKAADANAKYDTHIWINKEFTVTESSVKLAFTYINEGTRHTHSILWGKLNGIQIGNMYGDLNVRLYGDPKKDIVLGWYGDRGEIRRLFAAIAYLCELNNNHRIQYYERSSHRWKTENWSNLDALMFQ